ncbi:MAG: 1-deoxy-D-xylulose-5-phosphate synthase [Treponema sp.]|nr:1-deoxy-D-xylulose-5-phosphate synthase [Treponema sp.]
MILQSIKSPSDLKKLPKEKLPLLSKEMREKIIEVVSHNGGHLASNLGVVELTIALHRVFDSPEDAVIFDVGHQCYPHKLLTGRYSEFGSVRKKNGISGFTRISESPHDYFDSGHASSSISSALGLLTAWEACGKKGKVVAVIGDGALTGGMAFEALNHAGLLAKNLIVVLNDNQMSISPNTGAVSRYLSGLTTASSYQNLRRRIDRAIDMIPFVNRSIGKFVYKLKRGLKGFFLSNNLFAELGFEYTGPLRGHDEAQLERVFRSVKKTSRPVVVHVVTKKGRGYSPAENNPAAFHGIGPFNISDGSVEKFNAKSFTECFSHKIVSLGSQNSRIACITAAMSKGTGLDSFARHFKNRFFDVGIAEEHAVTFAGGLAAGGMIPVVAIYSTFIQRSVDQIIEDVALPDRHVVMVFDRAGAVPDDGETHQGIFDISLLRCIPNLTFMTVTSENDMSLCLDYAVNVKKSPVCLRWSKNTCPNECDAFSSPVEEGRGIYIKSEDFAASLSFAENEKSSDHKKILLCCTGSMYPEVLQAARRLLLEKIEADIFIMRFIKPFDFEYFYEKAKYYDAVLFIEDGVKTGGIGLELSEKVRAKGPVPVPFSMGFPDKFTSNGNRNEILSDAHLDAEGIYAGAKNLLGLTTPLRQNPEDTGAPQKNLPGMVEE